MYDNIPVLPSSVEGLVLGGDDDVEGDVTSEESLKEESTDEEFPDDESEEELIF